MWFLVFRKADSQGDIYSEYASIGSIQSTAQGSGSASAKESATITVPANGTVQELLAAVGDTVTAGQPIQPDRTRRAGRRTGADERPE